MIGRELETRLRESLQFSILFFLKTVLFTILEDCSGFTTGDPIDGVYNISPNRSLTENVPVYCEFSSDGAWTVRIDHFHLECSFLILSIFVDTC